MALPDGFKIRMQQLLGAEAVDLFAALESPTVAGLRLNTLKVDVETFKALTNWSLNPIPWTSSGFYFADGLAPGRHPFHIAGLYYLQEPSAMAVAEVLAPEPGDMVLDLAAAPGGKSTHLATCLQDKGLLVANEVNRGRAKALLENLERWGLRNAVVMNEEVSRLASQWGSIFDKVLLDAPCSGEGMFRKSTEALEMWTEANIQQCAVRQDGLLADAAKLVKPGGRLVYSTCTFAPEENERVVDGFLQTHPEFRLKPISLPNLASGHPNWVHPINSELAKTARLWPHKLMGEGHFIAKFQRLGGSARPFKPAQRMAVPSHVKALWQAFVKNNLPCDPVKNLELAVFGNQLYALPAILPDLKGLHCLRAGLWLGTLLKNRLEPSHSLALAFSREVAQKIRHIALQPDDPRITAYLQGDVLEEAGENGWLLVLIAGFPVGWGKRSQAVIKNAFPRGLRISF